MSHSVFHLEDDFLPLPPSPQVSSTPTGNNSNYTTDALVSAVRQCRLSSHRPMLSPIDPGNLSDSSSQYQHHQPPASGAASPQPPHLGTSCVEEEHVLKAIVHEAEAQAPKVGLDHFHILRLIGRGAYGKVFLVQHKLSGQYYAMKAIHKAFVTEDTRNIELTRAERTILEDVQHPFIVRLFYAFQTDHRLYLILEYIPGGELFHHLYHECMFPERVARFFIAEVVCALEHLHTLGIIYRDLKPENCLIDREGHLVLTDFGLSKLGLPSNGKTSTFCGTTEYMAPEILNEQPYDQAVDWWSLGILLFDMITGSPPFTGDNKNSVMNAIRRAQLKFPRYVSPAARQLVQALLHKDPAKRLGTFTGPITTHRARRPMPSGGGGLGRRHSRIRQHKFFDGLDWAAVEARTVKSPIIPKIRGDDDTSNFSTEFTSQPIAESPGGLPPPSPSTDILFHGFSYTAESHHFG